MGYPSRITDSGARRGRHHLGRRCDIRGRPLSGNQCAGPGAGRGPADHRWDRTVAPACRLVAVVGADAMDRGSVLQLVPVALAAHRFRQQSARRRAPMAGALRGRALVASGLVVQTVCRGPDPDGTETGRSARAATRGGVGRRGGLRFGCDIRCRADSHTGDSRRACAAGSPSGCRQRVRRQHAGCRKDPSGLSVAPRRGCRFAVGRPHRRFQCRTVRRGARPGGDAAKPVDASRDKRRLPFRGARAGSFAARLHRLRTALDECVGRRPPGPRGDRLRLQ
ncbi:Uncharacterised protein [Mycobacteroides abscessus subsp. massiliense]|nr:Uncharacterised protein [Mycobacteroides abscessus subsp. massiliense]